MTEFKFLFNVPCNRPVGDEVAVSTIIVGLSGGTTEVRGGDLLSV